MRRASDATGLTFVIVCLGRTGSTHLGALLDSHPDIRCFGELFTGKADVLDEVFLASGHDDPRAYVAELAARCSERVVGFKLPLGSVQAHPEALSVLEDDGLRFVRITRRNRLALLVSRRLLATTQVPQSTHGSYGDATVRLDPARVARALERIEEHDGYLDSLVAGRPTFRLTYEELVGEKDLDPLQRFLGVQPRPLSSVFERLRTRPLSATVENWDEVSDALAGTPHEPFLSEASP